MSILPIPPAIIESARRAHDAAAMHARAATNAYRDAMDWANESDYGDDAAAAHAIARQFADAESTAHDAESKSLSAYAAIRLAK